MQSRNFPIALLYFSILLSFSACTSGDDEAISIPPTTENAKFSFSFDPENPNKVIFTANPDVETWYTHWDFGDNTAGEGMDVTKTYFLAGDYTVRFKIFTEDGTAESTQMLSIAEDIIGANLIENGELDSDDSWTLLPITGGVDITFQNGAASWSGGGWGNIGIYQTIDIEADIDYQINMDIEGGPLSDSWFEVYVGLSEPIEGVDYSDGGIRMGLNTWDGCGGEAFVGQFVNISCKGNGRFKFTEDVSAYFVIRGGGGELGENGVTIDNISIRPL